MNPSGVGVDAVGNVYIANTDAHTVVAVIGEPAALSRVV
jgi:hypothetical protein